MGCGQGHPGTKYDYGAMSAVCWLLQHFLQQTSTIALWAIQILGSNEVQTSPLIHSKQNNQARAQTWSIWHHILEQCLCKITLMHYLSKTIKHGPTVGTGSPQGPAGTGSEGRLWWPEQQSLQQTLSSNYSHFVTQISLITSQGEEASASSFQGQPTSTRSVRSWEAPNGRKKPPQPIFFTTLERRLPQK